MNLYNILSSVFQLHIDEMQAESAFSRLMKREFEFKHTALPLSENALRSISHMIDAAHRDKDKLVKFEGKYKDNILVDYSLNVSFEKCKDFMREYPLQEIDEYDAIGLYARIISAFYVQEIREKNINLLMAGRRYTKEETERSFKKMCEEASKILDGRELEKPQSICSNSFFKEARLTTSKRSNEKLTPWDRWLQDDLLLDNAVRDCVLTLIKQKENKKNKQKNVTLGNVGNNFESKAGATYQWPIYRTILTFQYIYSEYGILPVSVLDPCGGWGDRLAGFMAMGVKYIIINDTNPALMPLYKDMYEKLKHLAVGVKWLLVCNKPAEEFNPDDLGPLKWVQCIHSGFPYGGGEGTEHYAGENGCSSKYFDHNAWLRGFLEPAINGTATCLEPGGIISINVDNFGKGNVKNDMIRIFGSPSFYDFKILDLAKNNHVRDKNITANDSSKKFTPMFIARYSGPIQPMGNLMLPNVTEQNDINMGEDSDIRMGEDNLGGQEIVQDTLPLRDFPVSVSMMSSLGLPLPSQAASSLENNLSPTLSAKPKKTIRKKNRESDNNEEKNKLDTKIKKKRAPVAPAKQAVYKQNAIRAKTYKELKKDDGSIKFYRVFSPKSFSSKDDDASLPSILQNYAVSLCKHHQIDVELRGFTQNEKAISPRPILHPNRVLIPFSGGIDSTASIFWALDQGYEVRLLHIYGLNRSVTGPECLATQKISEALGLKVITVKHFEGKKRDYLSGLSENPAKNQYVYMIALDEMVKEGCGKIIFSGQKSNDGRPEPYFSDDAKSFELFYPYAESIIGPHQCIFPFHHKESYIDYLLKACRTVGRESIPFLVSYCRSRITTDDRTHCSWIRLDKSGDFDPSIIFSVACYVSIESENKIYYFNHLQNKTSKSKSKPLQETDIAWDAALDKRFGADVVGIPKELTDADILWIGKNYRHFSASNECGSCEKCKEVGTSRARALSGQLLDDKPIIMGASHISPVAATMVSSTSPVTANNASSASSFGLFPMQSHIAIGAEVGYKQQFSNNFAKLGS